MLHSKYETLRNMIKPTDKELEILKVIWSNGPSTVRFVNDTLSAEQPIGYTTTLKFMQIMHEKGLLTREKEGKTHIYSSAISEEVTQNQLLSKLLTTAFSGSKSQMVMQLLGNSKSTPEELEEIRKFLDEMDK